MKGIIKEADKIFKHHNPLKEKIGGENVKYKYTRRAHYRNIGGGRKVLVRGHVAGHKGDKVKTGQGQDAKRYAHNQNHERLYRGVKKTGKVRVKSHLRKLPHSRKRQRIKGHMRKL